jgi:phospholipase C
VPVQEPGNRPARALPYRFEVEQSWTDRGLTLRFVNQGPTGVVFGVQDEQRFPGWRYFTVAAQSALTELWPVQPGDAYALVVHGPNSFYREYRGPAGADGQIETRVALLGDGSPAGIVVRNRGIAPRRISSYCAHSGSAQAMTIAAQGIGQLAFPSLRDHRWYDVALIADGIRHRLAGHVETGAPDISEPVARYPHPV